MATQTERRERRRLMAIDVQNRMPITEVMKKYAVSRPMVNRAIKELEEEIGGKITRQRASRVDLKQTFERGFLTVVWRMAVPVTLARSGAPGSEHRTFLNWNESLISLHATCKATGVKVTAQSFGGFHSEDYQSDFNREPYLLLKARLDSEPLWGV